MKSLMGRLILTCVIVCTLTYVMGSIVTGTVEKEYMGDQQYAELEARSVQEMKKILDAYYLSDGGIMLTKTMQTGEKNNYHMQIYHKGMERFDYVQTEKFFNEVTNCLREVWGDDAVIEQHESKICDKKMTNCSFWIIL